MVGRNLHRTILAIYSPSAVYRISPVSHLNSDHLFLKESHEITLIMKLVRALRRSITIIGQDREKSVCAIAEWIDLNIYRNFSANLKKKIVNIFRCGDSLETFPFLNLTDYKAIGILFFSRSIFFKSFNSTVIFSRSVQSILQTFKLKNYSHCHYGRYFAPTRIK